jgi:hypothetical protein
MKPESALLACFAKVEWAETEINNLQVRIDDLFRPAPNLNIFAPQPFPGDRPRPPPMPYPTGLHKSASKVDSNGVEVWRYTLPDIPTAFNVTVGAILHSLRSPLDQMLSAIALQNHDSPRDVSFPFGRNRDEFRTSLARQKKLPTDALKMIETLKPYKTGNKLLYALHTLNNPDKHHPGLIPINMQMITNMTAVGVYRGMVLTVGPRSGRHLALDADGHFSQSDHSKRPALEVIGDYSRMLMGNISGKLPKSLVSRLYNQTSSKLRPDQAAFISKAVLPSGSPKDDMEIATAIPGTQFEIEVNPAFNIALGDIEGFERQPVVTVLHQMRQVVHRILLTFEKRFF